MKEYRDIKDIAREIRGKLKVEFPKCRFSVTIERYSGGQSMSISLMSAPFEAIIEEIHGEWIAGTKTYIRTPVKKMYAQLNQYVFKDGYEGFNNTPAEYGSNNGAILTREAWDCMARAYELTLTHNWDNSDPMTDYFDVNFYVHLNIGEWDKPFVNSNASIPAPVETPA
jgi:hypothetical protein